MLLPKFNTFTLLNQNTTKFYETIAYEVIWSVYVEWLADGLSILALGSEIIGLVLLDDLGHLWHSVTTNNTSMISIKVRL